MKAWRTQLVLLTVVVALMWVTSGFIMYPELFHGVKNYLTPLE